MLGKKNKNKTIIIEYDDKITNKTIFMPTALEDSDYVPIVRNPALDKRLVDEFKQKVEENSHFFNMLEFRKKLPSFQMKDVILFYLYIIFIP